MELDDALDDDLDREVNALVGGWKQTLQGHQATKDIVTPDIREDTISDLEIFGDLGQQPGDDTVRHLLDQETSKATLLKNAQNRERLGPELEMQRKANEPSVFQKLQNVFSPSERTGTDPLLNIPGTSRPAHVLPPELDRTSSVSKPTTTPTGFEEQPILDQLLGVAPFGGHLKSQPNIPNKPLQPAPQPRNVKDAAVNAANSFAQGLTQVPSGLLKSIGVAAKAIDDKLPEWMQSYGGKATQDLATYQLGLKMEEIAKKHFPTNPKRQKEFLASVLPNALGNMTGFLAGGLGSMAVKGSRLGTTLVLGGGVEGAGQFEEAQAHEADIGTSRKAFLLGLGIGATEAIPIEAAFNRINKLSEGGLKKAMAHGLAGTQEFFQEFFQTAAGNKVAQELYDENRKVLDNAGLSASAGGVSGIIMSVALGAVRARSFRQAPGANFKERLEKRIAAQQSQVDPVAELTAQRTPAPPARLADRRPVPIPVPVRELPEIAPLPDVPQPFPMTAKQIEQAPDTDMLEVLGIKQGKGKPRLIKQPRPSLQPSVATEQPPAVTEQTISEKTVESVPRSTLPAEQNAELLLRATKAQADLEIAGKERGGRFFEEVQGKGSTREVTGLKSPTASWFKDLTNGKSALSKDRVQRAINKIIKDHGLDVGKDVQRVKEAILADKEFAQSEFAPKSEQDWAMMLDAVREEQESGAETVQAFGAPIRGLEALQANMPARIPVAPIPDQPVQPLKEIVFNLSQELDQKVIRGKTSRGAGGVYKPGEKSVTVKSDQDLDTVAHELAHALDDKLGLLPNTPEGQTSEFDGELEQFWVYGSVRQSGPRSFLSYKRAEGVAEWMRAWLLNPDATQQAAPRFTDHVLGKLDDHTRQALNEFSHNVRSFAGATAHDKIMSNIQWEPPQSELLSWLTKGNNTGPGFQLTWADQAKANLTDRLNAFQKAIQYARGQKGLRDAPPPNRDPLLLTRLLMGMNSKIDSIFDKGMVDAQNRTVTPGGLAYLVEPLDTDSTKNLEAEMRDVASFMIAQRTIEKAIQAKKEIRTDIAEKAEVVAMQRSQRIYTNSIIKELDKYGKRGDRVKTILERSKEQHEVTSMERARKISNQFLEEAQAGKKSLTRENVKATRRKAKKAYNETKRRLLEGEIDRLAKTNILTTEELTQVKTRAAKNAAEDINKILARAETIIARRSKVVGTVAHPISGVGGGILNDIEVAKTRIDELQSNPERFARIQEAAKRYREWADANLQYLVQKNRISQEQYEGIKANNEFYVAMQRIMEVGPNEEIVMVHGKGSGGKKLGSVVKPVQAFEGSTREIKNPYRSLMDATYKAVREADRNEVMQLFADLLTNRRGMHGGPPQDLASVGRLAKTGEPNTITIFREGEKEVWQFHPEVYKALKGVDEGVYRLPGMVTILPRILRSTIVNTPAFAFRNLIRDAFHRTIVSQVGSKPQGTLKKPTVQETRAFKLAGGDQAGHYYTDQVEYQKALTIAMKEAVNEKKSIVVDPAKMGRGYLNLMQQSERQGRLAEYRAAFKVAKDKLGYDDYNASLYAASQSRELLDYAVAGNWTQLVNQVIPFTNAAVQGVRINVRRAVQDPAGYAARFGLFAVLPTLATYLWNHLHGDIDEYRDMPAYMRDLFWNFKLGPDLWLRVPKPFEIGVLATTVERTIDQALGNDQAFEGHVGAFIRTMLPADEAALMGPFQALGQAAANKDFFRDRRPVPKFEEDLALELRSTHRASRLAQAIQEAIGVDARSIDFVLKQQFGYVGRYATSLSDTGRKGKGLGLQDVGVFATSPGTTSPDVQWVIDMAKERGALRTKEWKNFRKRYMEPIWETEEAERRDLLKGQLRREAKRLRRRWERRPPRPKAEEKVKKRREREGGKDPLLQAIGIQ